MSTTRGGELAAAVSGVSSALGSTADAGVTTTLSTGVEVGVAGPNPSALRTPLPFDIFRMAKETADSDSFGLLPDSRCGDAEPS